MGYRISAYHESPPNPEYSFWYNQTSNVFEPGNAVWTDICEAWRTLSDGSTETEEKILLQNMNLRIASEGKRHIDPQYDNGCPGRCRWTFTYTPCTVEELGTNPADVSEDAYSYYYYVVKDPSVRTQDFNVPFHYFGRNPEAAQLNQALGTDVLRAICWRESAWRQFDGSSRPLCHRNSNGTADWGCMQINQAQSREIWDWLANVNRARQLYAQKEGDANRYLNQHGPVTPDMLLNESIQRYNGGTYYSWNEASNSWKPSPRNDYVAKIREFMNSKPWGAYLEETDSILRVSSGKL
jgi:hypothetical protein